MSTDSELIISEPVTGIIASPSDDQILGEFADLRHMMMSLPVALQAKALSEIKERRDNFRKWLLSQLVEGVHYGVPPGCEAKINQQGQPVDRRGNPIDPKQWRVKPTLYAAGSDFICEITGLRDEYEADMASWEQLGKPEMTYVRKCRLVSRKTNEIVGEGTGGRKVSQNDGKVNDAIKMADKSAKQAAVFNAYGLRDLFVQESEPPQSFGTPDQKQNAPRASTRDTRVSTKQLSDALARWSKLHDDERASKKWVEYWASFCYRATGKNFDVAKSANWDSHLYQMLCDALTKEEGGEPNGFVPTPEECSAQQSDLPF